MNVAKLWAIIESIWSFIYRLFFTRDDDLDMLQVLFVALIVVAIKSVWFIVITTTISDPVKIKALTTLQWMIGLLVVTAVPKWLVPTVAKVVMHKKLDDDDTDVGGGENDPNTNTNNSGGTTVVVNSGVAATTTVAPSNDMPGIPTVSGDPPQ